MSERFIIVGPRQERAAVRKTHRIHFRQMPLAAMLLLLLIALGCLGCDLFIPRDPAYMDLMHCGVAPCREFWFGTDAMGRDIFSMIWHGGRISLCIGALSTAISAAIGILFGAVSGMAPKWLDDLLMRATELILSIPNLLIIVLVQAILGKANIISLSIVIGITSWTSIAKVVRSEVAKLRTGEYVIASRCMGGGFFHVLRRHLLPNLVSSVMFMVVMNLRGAIIAESTLSFMGIGLPTEVISWGSMLSLSEKALLTGAWWIIVIPGAFLIATVMSVTAIGNYLRRRGNSSESKL